MKPLPQKILTLTLALLAVTSARATPVTFSFSGTASSVTRLDFRTLWAVGDVVSGAFTFNLEAPILDTPFPQTGSGGYSVPAGFVSGFSMVGKGACRVPGFASLQFEGGTGPTAMLGGDLITLMGIWIGMDVNGFTATLDDYLALTTSDFHITVFGRTDFGNGGWMTEPVGDLNLTRASLALPDAGSTGFLLLPSLGFLSLARVKGGCFFCGWRH